MSTCGGHDDERLNVICEVAAVYLAEPTNAWPDVRAAFDLLRDRMVKAFDLCPVCWFQRGDCACKGE